MGRHLSGACRCGFAVFLVRTSQTFRARATERDAPNINQGACRFSRLHRSPCFDGGVCLRVVACSWRSDAAGVCVARGDNDCRHRDDSDSQYQSNVATEWLAAFLYLPEVLYLVILFWLFFSG